MPTDYTQLPNNSKAAQKAQQTKDIPHAKPVAEGQVVEEKEAGGFVRLLRIFFAMSLREMWQRVKKEVLLPSAKNMAHDLGSSALDLMLYGDGATPTVTNGGEIRYNEISTKKNLPAPKPEEHAGDWANPAAQTYKLLLKTYQDAENVRKAIVDYISQYGKVTVGYVRELVKLSTAWPDYQSGWTTIDGAHISQSREGWTLTLPKPKTLE